MSIFIGINRLLKYNQFVTTWANRNGGKCMNTKEVIAKAIAKASYKAAEKNANTACVFLHGQPKMPDCVKKLNRTEKKDCE